MIDTNVMELVLDNRRQLGRSFEHCKPFAHHAQAVRGKVEDTQRKDSKG